MAVWRGATAWTCCRSGPTTTTSSRRCRICVYPLSSWASHSPWSPSYAHTSHVSYCHSSFSLYTPYSHQSIRYLSLQVQIKRPAHRALTLRNSSARYPNYPFRCTFPTLTRAFVTYPSKSKLNVLHLAPSRFGIPPPSIQTTHSAVHSLLPLEYSLPIPPSPN